MRRFGRPHRFAVRLPGLPGLPGLLGVLAVVGPVGPLAILACDEHIAPTAAPDATVPVDAASDAAVPGADASDGGSIADGAADAALCTGAHPHCGSCDFGHWADCTFGQWVCDGGFQQLGCECYSGATMGLSVCCPSADGASIVAVCTVLDGGAGRYGGGVATCTGGQTPYVKEAGSGGCP